MSIPRWAVKACDGAAAGILVASTIIIALATISAMRVLTRPAPGIDIRTLKERSVEDAQRWNRAFIEREERWERDWAEEKAILEWMLDEMSSMEPLNQPTK